jgi:small subunit ribosomal protein S6
MHKDKRKALYEGMYILSATLSDESRKKAFDKITDGITQKGGEIRKTFEQGRKKLAYAIDGKREGYYYVLFFDAPTQIIGDLWKEYLLHEDLIRFMTIRAEEAPESLEFKPLKTQG